jgi:hypothetical protein
MASYIQKQWHILKGNIEYADIAFVLLRAVIFWGVALWLIFSHVSQKTTGYVTSLIVFFFIYSLFIYILLFFLPKGKRIIYKSSLLFDFLFTTLLVKATGGFESPFSNGFYLMTALYWTDISVRVAFLFLVALPLGMLSQKLERDRNKIELLHKELKKHIEKTHKE